MKQLNIPLSINLSQRAITPASETLFPACVMAISSLIAFLIVRYFQWPDGFWAVVSIAAVTQKNVYMTFNKTLLRLFGTLFGAVVAFYSVSFLPQTWLIPIFFIGLFVCLSIALAATEYRYFMIITGLTYTLVIGSGLDNSVQEMAVIRTYEVALGCIICLVVSYSLGCFFPKIKHHADTLVFRLQFKKYLLFESCILTLSCGVTFLTWLWLNYPLGYWGTISCLFVIEENAGRSFDNGLRRILGHIFIVGFGALIAIMIPASNLWMLAPLTIGLFFCGYTLGLKNEWLQPMGNTMGIALSCMLLASSPGLSQIDVVTWRFINVAYGVTVAFITIYIANRFRSQCCHTLSV